MHGTVEIGGSGAAWIYVSAWGHGGDFHETSTDALGIYAFEDLDASAQYNIVVNASFTESGFVAVDGNHAFDVRDNVELVAGPDAWHGENFALGFEMTRYMSGVTATTPAVATTPTRTPVSELGPRAVLAPSNTSTAARIWIRIRGCAITSAAARARRTRSLPAPGRLDVHARISR